ncbi:MAG: glycosyltransferase [Gemmatimonadaceae bacterium]
MNVLFLAHSFPRFENDPVGSFVLRLATALRSANISVRVVAPGGPGLAARDQFEGIVVDRFRYAPRSLETLAYTGTMRDQVSGSWGGRAALAGFFAAGFAATLRASRDFRADLVHAHWCFPGGLIGTWLRGVQPVPLVTTLHGTDLRFARVSPVARRMFGHVLRRSDAVTAVSGWLAEETRALVPTVNPMVAPMPVLPGAFSPGGPREPNRLLFVGKLNAQKGVGHLLHALALMCAKPMVDIVVGVGSSEGETRQLAASLGVADQLRWHPLLQQQDLAALYRTATALVSPSVDEGLGLVAVEAQLSELPVVAFRSGGLTEVVVHERSGLLVPPGDVAALASALDRLLARPDAGAEWGREGRHLGLEKFAPEAAAARYAGIYHDALRARSSRSGATPSGSA